MSLSEDTGFRECNHFDRRVALSSGKRDRTGDRRVSVRMSTREGPVTYFTSTVFLFFSQLKEVPSTST